MADRPEIPLPPALFFNVMRVSHSKREFYIDFGQAVGGDESVSHLVGRFVTTPEHFRDMVKAMTQNLERFDKQKKTNGGQ